MSQPDRETIRETLRQVKDAGSGRNVIDNGMISGIVSRDGRVGFAIEIPSGSPQQYETLRLQCIDAVKRLPGVENVTAVLTAEGNGAPAGRGMKPDSERRSTPVGTPQRPSASYNTEPLAHIRHVVAIASGKGGVGKSTTTVNLAHALTAEGKRIGILDADIYGPSIPRMMGVKGQPGVRDDRMQPLENHGIKCLSMGLIAGDEAPVIWRGPMITKALQQMLRATAWGSEKQPLDVLLVDMPPGTGDIQLSMAQQVPLSGAIIVTTPQEVATLDARKCLQTFQRLNVPVLGIVENMSYFIDPASGNKSHIFGEGGGRRMAEAEHAPFLGEIPVDMRIRESADAGKNPESGVYSAIAQAVFSRLSG